MKRKVSVLLLVTLISLLLSAGTALAAGAYPQQQAAAAIQQSLKYFHSIQNQDGGFPSKAGQASSTTASSWVVMALAAAGEDIIGTPWSPGGKSPLDYLQGSAGSLQATNDYARMLLALSAAGHDPVYQGINIADKISSFQQPSGQFAQLDQGETGYINAHMWSILALHSAGYTIPNQAKAQQWLISRQNSDGGFGWTEGIASDADDTGIAIQALIVLGESLETSPVIQNALAYLQSSQSKDGGINCGNDWMGSKSNAASTAWTLQGLIAAGENPVAEKWTIEAKNPVMYLLTLQNGDGSFNFAAEVNSSPVTMTAYSVMALAQKAFPVKITSYTNKGAAGEEKGSYNDLTAANWAFKPIMELVEAQVLSGYPDGSFKPDKTVTRAEFTRFMVSGLELENEQIVSGPGFTDTKNHWANQYIAISSQKGIVSGKPDGSFNPEGLISGAELATMLVKALPEGKTVSISAGPFWYSGYVELAEKDKLLYPGFQADQSATRAQCAYSIVQLRNFLAKV